MPIIVKAVAGKPDIDMVPKGYWIYDWTEVEEGYVVFVHKEG